MDKLADPKESEMKMLQGENGFLRIGIFLCGCGRKISSVLPNWRFESGCLEAAGGGLCAHRGLSLQQGWAGENKNKYP